MLIKVFEVKIAMIFTHHMFVKYINIFISGCFVYQKRNILYSLIQEILLYFIPISIHKRTIKIIGSGS